MTLGTDEVPARTNVRSGRRRSEWGGQCSAARLSSGGIAWKLRQSCICVRRQRQSDVEFWQNGAVTASARSYGYTSFNMPLTFAASSGGASVSETYIYGPEHQRVKQVSTTLGSIFYLNPDASGGLAFEKNIKPDSSMELRNYVTAGGSVVAEIKQITSSTGVATEQTRYFLRDNLGSANVITDEAGNVVERLAYEPFGKRRQVTGAQDPGNTILGTQGQRGFTNHEHMDELGLVNMNGRVYDPMTARFLSADPLIQAPYNSQSYNRYSYVINSPLNLSDPTGFSFWSDPAGSVNGTLTHWGNSLGWEVNHWGDVIATNPNANLLATVAVAYYTQQWLVRKCGTVRRPEALRVGSSQVEGISPLAFRGGNSTHVFWSWQQVASKC